MILCYNVTKAIPISQEWINGIPKTNSLLLGLKLASGGQDYPGIFALLASAPVSHG